MSARPTVLAVSGNLHVIRQRECRRVVHEHVVRGWRVDPVDGERPGELRASLSTLLGGQILVVVENPEKADLQLLQDHHKDGDPDVVVLLDHEGKANKATKFGKFAASLGKEFREFNQPEKPWEQEAFAVRFCSEEAQRHHKALPENLARAIVARSGADVGFLSFEIQKMATLSDIDGTSEITIQNIRDGLAAIAQVLAFPVVEALADRDRSGLAQALDRVRKTNKDDQTIGLCRLVGSQATRWLGVIVLREKGVRGEEAARTLGENAWYFNNKMEPQTRKWDGASIRSLIRALAESERGVRAGHVSPWIGLTARLLDVCG